MIYIVSFTIILSIGIILFIAGIANNNCVFEKNLVFIFGSLFLVITGIFGIIYNVIMKFFYVPDIQNIQNLNNIEEETTLENLENLTNYEENYLQNIENQNLVYPSAPSL